MKWIIRIFLLVLLNLVCETYALSQSCTTATCNAATCNESDVFAAMPSNSNANSTVTVNIPACTSGNHWTSQFGSGSFAFTVPSGITTLNILGAGSLSTTGGNDQTVIIDDYAAGSSLIVLNTNSTSTSLVRLAGITVKAGLGPSSGSGAALIGPGGSEQFRFDHSHLDTSAISQIGGMRITGCIYGVADHNIIDTAAGFVNNGIQEYNQGSCHGDSLGVGDKAWSNATTFGTASAFYLENNTFNNGFANDCTQGGAFVMRFNTFNEPNNSNSVVQTHPTGGAGRWRGCRQSETYMNTFNITSFMNACFFYSSGTGLMWGNSAASSSAGGGEGCKQMVQFESVLVSNVAYGQTATPAGWGYCGTQSGLTGNGSNWDGNTVASTGYACLDQPGRGQGDLLTGGFTSDGSGTNNVANNATSCTSGSSCAYPRQALEPVYLWGSGWLATGWQPVPMNTSHFAAVNTYGLTSLLTPNVDYYTGIDDSGNPISFTGATGVGAGTRAARPSTCTNGVAYWSTDQGSWNSSGSGGQGVLDLCSATNTWTNAWYVPYAYPHPLVSGTTNYSLTVAATNGSVSGTNCSTGTYAGATTIGPCTATPNSGYVFTGWTAVTGTAACSGVVNPCPSFAIGATTTFTANFSSTPAGVVLSGQILLSWVPGTVGFGQVPCNSTNQCTFAVYRCPGSGCSNWAEIAVTAAGATGYVDIPGTGTWSYNVKPNLTGIIGPVSNTVVLTMPPIPAAVSVSGTVASN